MKKLLFLWLWLLPLMAQAQTYYRCVRDKVNVKCGPGNNYKNVPAQGQVFGYAPYQLFKNQMVKYLGKRQNGFLYVECTSGECDNWHYFFDKGWVSSQFLKPAVRCRNCKGARVCKRCPPQQCVHKGFEWCFRTDENVCTVCDGYGWL